MSEGGGGWGLVFFNVLKKLSSIAFSNLPLSVLKSFILINVIGSLNFFLVQNYPSLFD